MTPPTQDTAAQTAVADAKQLFANLELPYLEELHAELTKHITVRREGARAAAAEEIRRIAKEAGISMEELAKLSARAIKPTRMGGDKKYLDPVSGKVWSGQGRRPQWVIDYLESGKDLADIEVPRES